MPDHAGDSGIRADLRRLRTTRPANLTYPRAVLLYFIASFTPLRFQRVRQGVFRAQRAIERRRRSKAEAAGDFSRSAPAMFEMDKRLAELIGEPGFFVEAGANDGFSQSNTYLLERRHGWRGVLVEPMPVLAAEARRARPDATVVECALGAPDQAGTNLRMHFAGLMSIVAGSRGDDGDDQAYIDSTFVRGGRDSFEVDVPCRTLDDVLDGAGAPEVDLLSLDLEGFEPAALRGLQRHQPRWLLIENHDAEARAGVDAVLGDRYVHVARFSELDDLYRRADVEQPESIPLA